MKYVSQEFQMVELDGITDRIKEHPKNPRRGNMAAISESMHVNGFYGALLVQASTGYILVGNHRFREAVRQGATEVPVFWADVDDEEALRILLADNKTSDDATYDESVLDELLAGLDSLEGTGYSPLQTLEEQIENGDGDFHLHAEDVGDDQYTPSWAVILECDSEEQQREIFEQLGALGFENIRLVAV